MHHYEVFLQFLIQGMRYGHLGRARASMEPKQYRIVPIVTTHEEPLFKSTERQPLKLSNAVGMTNNRRGVRSITKNDDNYYNTKNCEYENQKNTFHCKHLNPLQDITKKEIRKWSFIDRDAFRAYYERVHKKDCQVPKIVIGAKERILKTARAHLFSHGYAEMTLRLVAQECNMAVGTIYNYFSSKDELVGSVMLEDWILVQKSMQEGCTNAATLSEGIKTIYEAIEAFCRCYEQIWKDYLKLGYTPDHFNQRHLMLRSQIEQMLYHLVSRFQFTCETDVVPLTAEMILCSAVQKDIGYSQLCFIINKVFIQESIHE
ncbi:MAG: TetR/AcrR family transcriptional regulator [Spirochaetia bacterium]|nr:TetR/AcrR family transcriptional regulator [Spirochaetia bacterium]